MNRLSECHPRPVRKNGSGFVSERLTFDTVPDLIETEEQLEELGIRVVE